MATKTLQQELKKRGPFASVEQEAMLSVMKTSDLLENRVARLLRQYDLTLSQYNILRILRGEGKPMPCLEIASRMIQVAPAITRVVEQLVDRQLVLKDQSPEDRRVYLVEITESAKSLLRTLDDPIDEMHKSLLGHVSERDLKGLVRVLGRVRNGIAE